MDSLNLKTLIEVVRTGSFSKAADNLFVTQSAVSRRIKCLEEEYGCPLLDRSGITVKPTGAGKLVIAEARKILAHEEKLIRQLKAIEEKPCMTFACTHPFGITYLPDVLKRYMKRYTDLKNFKISFEMPYKALQGLQENRFDFILIEHWELLDLSEFMTLSLPEDEMIFVSSPALGLSTPLISIDELVHQRLYRRKEECCSWKYLTLNMQIAGRDIGEFTQTVVYDDLHVIIQSLINGDGIALISKDLVQQHISEGTLCEHRVEGVNHRRKRSLILKDHAMPHTAMKVFIACIFASFGLEPPDIDTLSLP
jgi:LysR family transcriptional regulator, transcriptional activator of the cysJI operon